MIRIAKLPTDKIVGKKAVSHNRCSMLVTNAGELLIHRGGSLMYSSHTVRLLLGLALCCFFAVPANAGFVTIQANPVGTPPGHGPPDFVWGLLPDNSGNAQAVLSELFSKDLGGSYSVEFSGITDSDPVLTVTKNVENATGFNWIGYSIDLDPSGAATFVGTPTSDKMTLASQTTFNLTFGLPSVVPDGDTVSFTFDINIPSTGPFGFTLTQTPALVPEPTAIGLVTMVLLSLAVARMRLR